MGRVAFLPWVHLAEEIEIQGVRFVPWDSSDAIEPAASILRPYRNLTGKPIGTATLAHLDGEARWTWTDPKPFFQAREILAVAALADRYSAGTDRYVNSDHFWPVVQGYELGRTGSLVTARTRHGGTGIRIAGNAYRVSARPHAIPVVDAKIDTELAAALADAVRVPGNLADSIMEAASLYLLANTDNPAYRAHSELLLSVSGIQQALGIASEHRQDRIVEAFESMLSRVEPDLSTARECPRRDPARMPPEALSARGLWMRDIYWRRNAIAHGDLAGGRPLWLDEEHLFLAAWILPLVLHSRCLAERSRPPTPHLRRGVRIFDRFLRQRNSLFEPQSRHDPPRWRQILSLFDIEEVEARLATRLASPE